MKIKKKKYLFFGRQAALHKNGKHSFLFWMAVPVILIWLTIGYITGIIGDKPIWFKSQKASAQTIPVEPYFQNHASFYGNLDQPFVTFWFDDAWLSQYLEAYPILKASNFTGTMAVPVNAVEAPGYMNWAQLKVIQKDGWEITNHSLAHDCSMQNWDREKIAHELTTSKLILWKNNLSSDIFVTPCGVDSSVMRSEATRNFMGYRTVDPGYNDPKDLNAYNLKVR
ncbi:MAG: polysaccharide deacetylase family protein, partial [Candidatus Omnitrophota bacterium]|nr:polysaccharide deacetylase family protein [Candidatus Omnitrophota bacterium]